LYSGYKKKLAMFVLIAEKSDIYVKQVEALDLSKIPKAEMKTCVV
jgi:hypothetical protein